MVTGGTLLFGSNASLGAAGASVTLSSGSAIGLAPNAPPQTINRTATITDSGGFNVASGNPLTWAGVIGGGGTLVKSGAGTVTLSGTNTYSSGTTVTDGLINFGSRDNFGCGGITLKRRRTPMGQWQYDRHLSSPSIGGAGGIFDTNGNTVTFRSGLSGPGGITKTGIGNLILSTSNTYSGATTVTGGVLRFTSDASLGAAWTRIILDGGSIGTTIATPAAASSSRNITLFRSGGVNVPLNPFTLSGAISGPGAFIKDGPGELTLTGNNTYTGGTILKSGTLNVVSDANLGAAGPGITMNGGALRASATFASPRNTQELSNGRFIVDPGQTLALSGAISGRGNLTKDGRGTLILTGLNAYTGGTFNNGGTLQGNTTSLRGNIAFDTNFGNTIARSVTFDQASNGTFAGNITGIGSLTKIGAGTLILSGTSSYRAGTTVSAGTLQGTTGSLQGNILNNRMVIFDQSINGTYAGAMTGTGTLIKNGTGTVTLVGASSVGGGTTINAGELNVNGSLTSDVLVNGGVLRGTGTITGNVKENGSTVEPGDIGIRKTGGFRPVSWTKPELL